MSATQFANKPIALVSMPFASTLRPSIQLGLLKAIAEKNHFQAATFHLNIDFAAQIGVSQYELIASIRKPMVGDWLFSIAAFGELAPDQADDMLLHLRDELKDAYLKTDLVSFLKKVRHVEIPRFLDALINNIAWTDFSAIGFTSTFQQNVASFSLAKLLEQRLPDVPIIFGGANFDGEMGRELARAVDCIDYAVTGEGDCAFPELLRALAEARDPTSIPGVISRRNGAVVSSPTQGPLASLDGETVPDYSEYFARLQSFGITTPPKGAKLRIPFESSRGCWWGQKHHCTFCGLNGATMHFRRKPTENLLRELQSLAHRHGIFAFEAVDNILDPKMLEELFELLSAKGIDYDFFYEVKSNLSRRQIRQLARGGLRRMQPGIESLSTPILKLMKKGVTSIQNVNLLRWACYYRIHTSWNLLWGFPGEDTEHYEEQLSLMRRLTHLPPPMSAGRVWMERFSPLFSDRNLFPAAGLRAERSYSYIYPKRYDLARIAYFFDYELADTLPDTAFTETMSLVARWQAAWRTMDRPRLVFWYSPGITKIEDRRGLESPRTFRLIEPEASLYAACSDQPRTAPQLKSMYHLAISEEEIEDLLNVSVANGLMMREGRQYLSLALPATPDR